MAQAEPTPKRALNRLQIWRTKRRLAGKDPPDDKHRSSDPGQQEQPWGQHSPSDGVAIARALDAAREELRRGSGGWAGPDTTTEPRGFLL